MNDHGECHSGPHFKWKNHEYSLSECHRQGKWCQFILSPPTGRRQNELTPFSPEAIALAHGRRERGGPEPASQKTPPGPDQTNPPAHLPCPSPSAPPPRPPPPPPP